MFKLTITLDSVWDDACNGTAETFWSLVENCDGEEILLQDRVILRKQSAGRGNNDHLVEFRVPMTDPVPPNYFIIVVSSGWMRLGTKLAPSFMRLILPERFSPHTPLLDFVPLPVEALKEPEFIDLYPEWRQFNKIQTQVFKFLFDIDDNMFIRAPTRGRKTVCWEYVVLRHCSKVAGWEGPYTFPPSRS